MEYEAVVTVMRKGVSERLRYYVTRHYSCEFECVMYNVGINDAEISDFSNRRDEAEVLCEYLYRENVSPGNLFLVSEEFIEDR